MKDELLNQILTLQTQADFSGIIQYLEARPEHLEHSALLLDQLSVAYAQLGQPKEALACLMRAMQLDPQSPTLNNHAGNIYRVLGDFDQAQRHYNAAISLRRNYPEAHNNLGALYYRQGQFSRASESFERALRLDPEAIDAHYNLANSYVQQDEPEQSIPHYKFVLEKRPVHLGAAHNLGMIYITLNRLQEAKPLLEISMNHDTPMMDAHFHYAMVLSSEGQLEQAVKLYEEVTQNCPKHANAFHNLGVLYLARQELDKAAHAFSVALTLSPSNATAQHFVRALKGEASSETSSAYLTDLFNYYADHYDKHLKESLHYQAPFLIREALTPYANQAKEPWVAIDIGCGTGLMAPLLQDIVLKLIGIDLAEKMIVKAKALGGYTDCYVGDCMQILPKTFKSTADLIVSADVFVYYGDLTKMFLACLAALKAGGILAFTLEATDKQPFELTPTGRFKHHEDSIVTLAQEIGFEVCKHEEINLREQDGVMIKGLLFLCRKSSPPLL